MLTLTLTLAALAYLATANANFAQCGDGLAPNATREGVPTPEFTPEGGDWFPDKAVIENAELFTVSYSACGNTKELTIYANNTDDVGVRYLLVQCGTALCPEDQDRVDNGDYTQSPIAVPVTTVAFTQTPSVNFADMLVGPAGPARSTFTKVTFPKSFVSSTCLVEMIDDGKLVDGNWAPDTVTSLTYPNVQVTFAGEYDVKTNLQDDDSIVVEFDEWQESSMKGINDYFLLAAVFFNAEKEATKLKDDVNARLDCVANNIDAYLAITDDQVVKVAWAYYSTYPGYEGWTIPTSVSCDTCMNGIGPWMVEALSILGIALKPPSGGKLSHAQFAEYARDADVLIYPDGNYESVMGNSTVAAIISGIPAIKNRRVFDVQGQGLADFFTSRLSALDVFVEDLATAIFSDDFEITGLLQHDLVFLRNVYTDPIGAVPACSGDYAPVLANACVPTEFVAQREQEEEQEDLDEFLSGAGGTRAGLLVATAAAAVAVLLL